MALGISKPQEGVAASIGVNPLVSTFPPGDLPNRLVAGDLRAVMAQPLMSVRAGIKDLRDQDFADEAVAGDLVALESAVNQVLARFEILVHASSEPRPSLSMREIQVLAQVATGLSDKEIGRRLAISQKTVRNHLSHVFSKLQASNRTEAVINGLRSGLLRF